MIFTLYDAHENQIGAITGIVSAEHEEGVDGTDTLTLVATYPLEKMQRIVWQDSRGQWHEHIIINAKGKRKGGGQVYTTATALNSVYELWGDWLEDLRVVGGPAEDALDKCLSGSRWARGTVNVDNVENINFYRTNAREGLKDICETYACEFETEITVQGSHVVARTLHLAKTVTRETGRRFQYGRNMTEIERSFDESPVITRLYGFGKGEEVSEGGYGRRIDFSSINGGLQYIEDAEKTALYGRPDGKPFCGKVEFDDCTDVYELLALTREHYEDVSVPRVTYEASVAVFGRYGVDMGGVFAKDIIQIVDTGFEPEIRAMGRITQVTRDLMNEANTKVTVGTVTQDASALLVASSQNIDSINSRAVTWDATSSVSTGYVAEIVAEKNTLHEQGGGYHRESFTEGDAWTSDPYSSAGATTKGVRLAGGKLALTYGGTAKATLEATTNGLALDGAELASGTVPFTINGTAYEARFSKGLLVEITTA